MFRFGKTLKMGRKDTGKVAVYFVREVEKEISDRQYQEEALDAFKKLGFNGTQVKKFTTGWGVEMTPAEKDEIERKHTFELEEHIFKICQTLISAKEGKVLDDWLGK